LKLLHPGEVIDGFEIEECVHAGGMAHIYKVVYAPAANGTRRAPEFPMAMKIPRMTAGDGAENIISFEIEHQIMPTLTGPHVPRFVAAGDLSRIPYLVMEYVQGQTLQHWLDRGDLLAPDEIARLGAAMAKAAHSLHRQNVCHLDLKPANVLIRPMARHCCSTLACRAMRITRICWPKSCARRLVRRSGLRPSRW